MEVMTNFLSPTDFFSEDNTCMYCLTHTRGIPRVNVGRQSGRQADRETTSSLLLKCYDFQVTIA